MNSIDFNEKKKIHFTGIGGISMSAIAFALLHRGFEVTGSDSKRSALTDELEEKGARVFIGQSPDNISEDVDMVVYTAAVPADNPELVKARQLNIPCVTRAQFLGEMMKNYDTAVCVSGTHGKTTTTSMLAEIMISAGMDPTIIAGGIMPSIGGNVRIGLSGNFLTEACEYTNSFLSFFPTVAVILNVKEDHMDFFKDLQDIKNSFRRFAQLVPDDGVLVINGEIDDLDFFTKDLKCRVITFGINGDFDFTAAGMKCDDRACREFDIMINNTPAAHVKLKVPGEHNVYNALAAAAAAWAKGADINVIAESVSAFAGVDRRFQYKGSIGGVTVIDDYAHHPDEIAATISAAGSIPHRKLWVVFQPHTYSRTKAFLREFAEQLSKADAVILADIYAARETNEYGVSSEDIMKLIQDRGTECYYFPTFDEIENFLLEHCESGDVFITMGAGDVVLIGDSLLGK